MRPFRPDPNRIKGLLPWIQNGTVLAINGLSAGSLSKDHRGYRALRGKIAKRVLRNPGFFMLADSRKLVKKLIPSIVRHVTYKF